MENGIDAIGRRVQIRIEHDIAAMDRILRDVGTCEIERAPVARLPNLGRLVLRVDGAHTRHQS